MEERRLPISYIKTELSCKICGTTDGKMEAIPCKLGNKKLIMKIFHCTNVHVVPNNDVISPVCEDCRELIDSYDSNAKPIFRDFVIKADMNIGSLNYDPLCEEAAPVEQPADILEPIVKIESLPAPGESSSEESSKSEDEPLSLLLKPKKVYQPVPVAKRDERRVQLLQIDSDDEEFEESLLKKRTKKKRLHSKKKSAPIKKKVEVLTPKSEIKTAEPVKLTPEKTNLENTEAQSISKQLDECSDDLFGVENDSDDDWEPTEKINDEDAEGPKKKKLGRPRTAKPKRLLQKCEICEKVVLYIREHMRVHETDKHRKCPYCDRTFSFRQSLKHHIMKHKGERPFKCDICGNRYVSKGDLNYHMEAHSTELKYQCHVCSKAFNQNIKLRAHLNVHSGIKREGKVKIFTCEMCGKTFNKKNNLNVHMMRHTGEKNFVCEECSKSFINIHALKRHIKSHERQNQILALEGAVRCEICGKAYVSEKALTVHMKCHEEKDEDGQTDKKSKGQRSNGSGGNDPAQCDICFKYFEKGKLMRKHRTRHFTKDGQQRKMRVRIRVVPDEHTPRCDICDRPFAKIKYMKEHRKKHFTERGVNGNSVVVSKSPRGDDEQIEETHQTIEKAPTELLPPRSYPHALYPIIPTMIKIENMHH